MNLAPVVLFVYNRPLHTKQTIEALMRNQLARDSELYVFSDGAKTIADRERVRAVRNYVKAVSGFKKVTLLERDENVGLSRSIISGVSDVVATHGRIIVLEDDIVTSPYFLQFMNEALELYKDDERIISIHGYLYPVKKELPATFFLRGADCWGWATWKRGWDLFEPDGKKLLEDMVGAGICDAFDFNGAYPYLTMLKDQIQKKNDSWAIRWYASAFVKDKLTLYPGVSLVQNIGFDGSGKNCGQTDIYCTKLSTAQIAITSIPVREDSFARREIGLFLRSSRSTLPRRVIRKIKGFF